MSNRNRYGDYGGGGGHGASSQSSSSRYNSSYGVDPWNESSTADVAYGDAYSGGYGDDGGHDPYNFKIKDPKKERKKKERKQRERERKRAKAKPQATRLSIEERTELRKKMVEKTVAEYRRLPRAKGKETEELIKDFTKHIDETVRAPDFVEKFNKLQIQTRISATSNSTQMEQSLQPLVVQQRDRIIGAFKQFDENGDGVVSWDEFRTGIRGVAPSVPAAAIEDMIHSMDKDGDGEIDYLEFSKKYGSAKTDPKTKQVMETVATGGAKNTRVKGQELDTFRMQKLPFAGHQSRSAMFKTRKLDYKRMADGKLSDIEKRYVRGHLQLHPQLMFFNKEF